MKSKFTQLVILASMGLVAVQAGAALAQSSQAQPSVPHLPQETMRDQIIQQQAEMHDKLKITPAQEAAWKSYAQAMEPDNPPKPRMDPDHDKQSTIERMQRSLDRIHEHEMKMQNKLNATKAFLNVLSSEQKKQFEDYQRKMRKEMQEKIAHQMQRRDGFPGDRP